MKTVILFTLYLTCLLTGMSFAQPSSYDGTFIFNLTEKEYPSKLITIEELKTKDIRFLSFNKESIVKYDTINKAFSFTSDGFETKQFAIVHKRDTIFIDYPSVKSVSVCLNTLIPLDKSNGYSFSNENIYDAISSNKNKYFNSIFYLCQGCLLSRYKMKEATKKQLHKYRHILNSINVL